MKPRQKLSLKTVYFDSYFNLLYCYLISAYSRSTLLAMFILSPSSSSQYIYFRVLLYQLPNLMMAGVAAITMKKLIKKTRTKSERWVMKFNSRLKMIYRCLTQSSMITFICWSNIPSVLSKSNTMMQKKTLRLSANKKQCFLLQFVKKKVSMPSFNVQTMIMPKVQKESKDQCLYTKPINILKTTNTTRLAVVISTRDSSLAKGYYLTFWYYILTTLISACVLVLFFLFLGSAGGACSSGGRKSTAPLGKKRKLGYLFLMSCMARVTSSMRSASRIMLMCGESIQQQTKCYLQLLGIKLTKESYLQLDYNQYRSQSKGRMFLFLVASLGQIM